MLQIEQYLKYFNIDQFHFLKFEDLVSADPEVFNRLCEFLCVGNIDLIGNSRLESNQAGFGPTSGRVAKLIRTAKYIPGVSHFVKRRYPAQQRTQIMRNLAGKLLSTPLGKILLKSDAIKVPELCPEDRELIRRRCKDDLKSFEALSKLDLSQWY